ncbi:uncharacterized protein [Eucyclogobius newberryi]|uniref:uncharacterized protein n=1 Tax=Eucyclogobius newberryi TaxID=166745 RepID=UPI003B5A2D15
MDAKYPSLKRPKKKLIYPTTKTSLPKQWAQDIVCLEDVDKMFDGLDFKGEDFPSPSPEIHIPKHEERVVIPACPPEELLECPMVANGDPIHGSPELDIDSESPFKAHGPVKTSSPIEGNEMQHKKKQRKTDGNSASPILFDCEEETQGLETAEKHSEIPQHKNCRKDESDDSMFETLPKKSAFDKMSAQKKTTTPVRSKPSCPPVSPVRLEVPAKKHTESLQVPTRVKHDMTSFLQKLRDAGQSKPAHVGLLQSKVMPLVPEPEPEDEFLILEDDAPLFVSIPSKTAKSLKEKQSKTLSSDKETMDTPNKLQGTELDHRNQEKSKKNPKDKVSESNLAASDQDQNLATAESNNADPLDVVQTKKKKTQIKSVPSKDDECEVNGTDDGKLSKKTERKVEKTVQKRSKPVNCQSKSAPAKEKRNGANKANAVADGQEDQSQEVNNQPSDDSPVSGVNNLEAKSTGDLEKVDPKPHLPSSSMEGTSDEGGVLGKRKRKPTGQWWMSCPQSPPQQQTDKPQTVKKAKHANKDLSAPLASPVKVTRCARKKTLKPSSSSSDCQIQKIEKKKVKKGNQKRQRPFTRTPFEDSDEVFQDRALNRDSDSSPLLFPHKKHSHSSGEKMFPKVYQNASSDKLSSTHDHASPTRPEGPLRSTDTPKRRRKSPGNWWQVNPAPEDQEVVKQKREVAGEKRKRPKKPTVHSPAKPLEGAPKLKKLSLASYSDLCCAVSPLLSNKTETKSKKQNNVKPHLAEETEAAHNVVTVQTEECDRALDQSPNQDTIQESVSKVIRSGPSSMIGLENYEEDDEDIALPSTTVQPALCASDLCAPPLRPLVLQPKDKVHLRDWLKSLWPTTDRKQRGPEITPDDFEWYCYQGRALGLMVDLQLGSICNGKMLLGSFMKKPLWVDHSATTVFNLLTSSVSLIVDCNKSYYSAGQSFMVPPGHAYSIHNLSAQPAVFYLTRVYAEESDE